MIKTMDWKVTGALLLIALVSAEARHCVDSTGRVVAPGEEFFDGCNYCKCGPIGMPSICTMRICPDNKQLLPPMFTNNANGNMNGTSSTFPTSFPPMYQALLGNSGLSSIFQPIVRQARLVWLKFRPNFGGVGGTLVSTTGPVNPAARLTPGGMMGASGMGAAGMRGMAAGGAGAGMGAGTMGTGAAGAMDSGRLGAGSIGAGGMAGMQNNMRSQRAMEMMRRLGMQNRAGMSGGQLGGGQPPINIPLLMLLGGKNGETGISKDFATSSNMRQLMAAMLANNQMDQMAAQGQMGGQLGMGLGGQMGIGGTGALGFGGQAGQSAIGGLNPFGAQLGMDGPGMLAQLDPTLAMSGLGVGPAVSVPVWQTKIPGAPANPMDGLMEAMLMRQLLNRGGGGGEGGAGGEGGGAAGGGGGEGVAAGGGEGGGAAGGGEVEGGAAQQNRGLPGLNFGLGSRLGLTQRQRPVVD